MDRKELRHEAWLWALRLWKSGINAASSGNFSVRAPGEDVIAVTPSGVRYDSMTEEQIVLIDPEGRVLEGGKPSVETPMHTAVYRLRPDIGAVAHTHSPYTIALAALGQPLPMISVEGLCAGNALVPVTPAFRFPGSAELARDVEALLRADPSLCAVLLRSHGLLAMGTTAKDAVSLAESLEVEAHAYMLARSVGEPERLSEETRQGILAHFAQRKGT